MRDTLIESVMEIQSAYADLDNKIRDALAQWKILMPPPAAIVILCMGQQVLSVTEIRRRRYYVGTNFTYCLDILTRLGLVEDVEHKADRRRRLLQLTTEGHALAGQLREYLSGRKSERNAA